METSVDQLVTKIYKNDIQVKRIRKEIQQLSENKIEHLAIEYQGSPFGIKILLQVLPSAFDQKELSRLPNRNLPFMFEIFLGEKFPFVFPKFFCRTTFSRPSLADGRDLLNDILGRPYSPSILLHDIVTQLIPFVVGLHLLILILLQKKVLANPDDKVTIQSYGTYHLGEIYNLEDFLVMERIAIFQTTELTQDKKSDKRYVVVTESNFLTFELIDKKKQIIRLMQWAHIQSLVNIKRKKDEENTIILTWKDSTKQDGNVQVFFMDEATKFIETVIRNMKNFGIKVMKNVVKQPDLNPEDVTGQSLQKMDIQSILDSIAVNESKLQVELSLEVINSLMASYQKAVEYFSAVNDPTYKTYMDRMHLLLQREDIRATLDSGAEAVKQSDGPGLGRQVPPIEEEEKI